MKPLVVDLYCGLGGFSEGFLAEGYQCLGFDVERHDYGSGGYPGELVLQDVLTLHGSQFRNAACIVASPPCQEFSYMAMPWKRAKQIGAALRCEYDQSGRVDFPEDYAGSRTPAELTALFDACFRIQREACEAAGRHIPLIVENVKGAQPWVGPAKANYGSFYLWGDIGMANGLIVLPGRLESGAFLRPPANSTKVPGMNFHEYEKTGQPGRSFQSAAVEGTKLCAQTRGLPNFEKGDPRRVSGAGINRKAASAQIAKIPFALSNWIARSLKSSKEAAA